MSSLEPGSRPRHVMIALAQRFRAGGLATPGLDARLLLAQALGLDATGLLIADDTPLTPAQLEAVEALARRRLAHEPVARILGRRQFWRHTFAVTQTSSTPGPIPRP